jgi:hypothetical protein
MGMHPLMDRRMISTPRHSSLAAANVAESAAGAKPTPDASSDKLTGSDLSTSWWSPGSLGMGDAIIQAGWEAIRDLILMSDLLFEGV